MPLASLSASYSTPDGRFKERRAAVRTIAAVVAASNSVRFPAASGNIPAAVEASTSGVNNVAYIYKPMADLLGLIASSDAGAFGGEVEPSGAADFLGDLSWLFASDDAASAASKSVGLVGGPFSSVVAANAAYESSMDSDDKES